MDEQPLATGVMQKSRREIALVVFAFVVLVAVAVYYLLRGGFLGPKLTPGEQKRAEFRQDLQALGNLKKADARPLTREEQKKSLKQVDGVREERVVVPQTKADYREDLKALGMIQGQ